MLKYLLRVAFIVATICSNRSFALQVAEASSDPTFPDIAYGPHERHRIDFWQAKGEGPRPMLVFIHGGGWNSGDKKDIPKKLLKSMLEKGVSVASINYRYTYMATIPGPLHDAARAIQFLRMQSSEWKIDPRRIGAYGVSAGGCSTMWLAFHDDLADPKNEDLVLRESSRLQVAVGISPPTSLEPDVVTGWIGEQVLKHAMIERAIGYKKGDELQLLFEQWRSMLHECSPIQHITADDPPTMLVFPRIDKLPAENPGSAIHHAIFGFKVKEKADALKLLCDVHIQESATPTSMKPEDFLVQHLMTSQSDSPK